ncbi:hypothetical protein OAB57_03080 [Bacteriovoracaceae bacterium]|nr:hypothetical protein [Bacteriovoracaceae bacterium]
MTSTGFASDISSYSYSAPKLSSKANWKDSYNKDNEKFYGKDNTNQREVFNDIFSGLEDLKDEEGNKLECTNSDTNKSVILQNGQLWGRGLNVDPSVRDSLKTKEGELTKSDKYESISRHHFAIVVKDGKYYMHSMAKNSILYDYSKKKDSATDKGIIKIGELKEITPGLTFRMGPFDYTCNAVTKEVNEIVKEVLSTNKDQLEKQLEILFKNSINNGPEFQECLIDGHKFNRVEKEKEIDTEMVRNLIDKDRHFNATEDLLKGDEVFHPIKKVTIKSNPNLEFYFGKIFKKPGDDRFYAIAYVFDKENKRVFPRLFFKSKSAGTWRVVPALGDPEGKNALAKRGYIWKGSPNREERKIQAHYTQETKPSIEIVTALNELTENEVIETPEGHSKMQDVFNFLSLKRENILEDKVNEVAVGEPFYELEQTYYEGIEKENPNGNDILHLFQKYQPGLNNRQFTAKERLTMEQHPDFVPKEDNKKLIDYLSGDMFHELSPVMNELYKGEELQRRQKTQAFIPTFKDDSFKKEYKIHHTILSKSDNNIPDITVRVFESILAGKPVEWHMAHDARGRIWIDKIQFVNAKVNSYGANSIIIDSGFLTNKPIEYIEQLGVNGTNIQQCKSLSEDEYPKGKGYCDFTPYLDQLLPVQTYRKIWGIERS